MWKNSQETIQKRSRSVKLFYRNNPNKKHAKGPDGKFIKTTPRKIFSGVYVVIHTSGRVYVGSSLDIHKRFQAHQTYLRNNSHSSKNMQQDWDIDPEGFSYEIIELETNRKIRKQKEQFWIDFFKPEYNVTPYVEAGKIFGKNMKGSPKGYKFSEEAKQHNRDSWTDERRKKVSEYNKSHDINPPRNNSIPPSFKDHNHTDISKNRMKNSWTPERKAAHSERMRKQWAIRNGVA